MAWDVATGNGQVANVLAEHFNQVIATDMGENQLKHAIQKHNINNRVESAEQSSLPDKSVDLITIAQAIHWFNFEAFYREVRRTLKPNGLIAVIGYPLFSIEPGIDTIIQQFYSETLHLCWDPERKYIDDHYSTIPFPFHQMRIERMGAAAPPSHVYSPNVIVARSSTAPASVTEVESGA